MRGEGSSKRQNCISALCHNALLVRGLSSLARWCSCSNKAVLPHLQSKLSGRICATIFSLPLPLSVYLFLSLSNSCCRADRKAGKTISHPGHFLLQVSLALLRKFVLSLRHRHWTDGPRPRGNGGLRCCCPKKAEKG